MAVAPVRFGLLGVAHDHANSWAQAIHGSTDAVLAGLWDDDARRGAEVAGRHGTGFVPDLAALLRDCEAVGITAETVHHAALTEAAAAAGVHVLCEKPMATTLEECDRMERAVRRAGVTFVQNYPKRFDPVHQELVGTVRGGDLGEVRLVRVRHGHDHGLDEAFWSRWYTDPALSGGGALLDEGVHAADLVRWLLGETQQVWATMARRPERPVEESAVAVFTFAGGARAEVTTGWTFAAAEQSVEVFGTAGAAVLSGVDLASRDFASPPYLKVFRRGDARGTWRGSPAIPYFVQGVTHQQGPRHLVECLRTGRPPLTGLADGRRALAMVRAAYRSAEHGALEPVGGTDPAATATARTAR
jgi:predicted dehydrogenase